MQQQELSSIVDELRTLPVESEWFEFKHNNSDPEEIGEYISALSNGALLNDKAHAYLVWGIEDQTKNVVGTKMQPSSIKIGSQPLEMWLAQHLGPKPECKFYEFVYQGCRLVTLCIRAVTHMPVRWKSFAYVRLGGCKTRLDKYPEKEKQLWLLCARQSYEEQIASDRITGDEVLELLDYPAYFELVQQPLPDKVVIIDRLKKERLVSETNGKYEITSLGALLFAKSLSKFPSLERKAIRVIIYKGTNKVHTMKERVVEKGYAAGFASMLSYINDQLPTNELIGQALRKEEKMYPELAIRELVANALIHQDLHSRGNGSLVEIFADRIEITNPGVPLINTLRFIDEPPQSRNEALASLMRRLNMCEERGSGIDKVIFSVELFQLPAPEFLVTENHTKAILFGYRPLKDMSRDDKIRACYQHACLCYVSNQEMSNATLRIRFGIDPQNAAIASRIMRDTADVGLIQAHDPSSTSRKLSKYVPYWAASATTSSDGSNFSSM